MIATEGQIDSLLNRLDALARRMPYPVAGLRIWGADSERSDYVEIVEKWIAEISPEGQR
ncbi:MAG: hypothetical protein QM813_17150 [Verrucomicrobiota bacterium]